MSRLRLTKKLQPAKKAWRSFSNKVQSKVNELNFPRAIKATIQRLVSTFHSLRHFISTKARRHRSLPTRPYHHYNSFSSYYHVQRKNFNAIRIDDLFAEPSASSSSSSYTSVSPFKGEIRSRSKAEVGNKDLGGKGESSNGLIGTIDDAWKLVVAKAPNLQVDEKAEEFIKKFREDMKIQKERSLLEFQEMLARGT